MPSIELVGEETLPATSPDNDESTSNPYMTQSNTSSTPPETENQPAPPAPPPAPQTDNSILGGIGFRPILYGCLFAYLLISAFLRNPTEEQNSGQAATSRNVDVPDVNGGNNQPMGALDDMENEFGDDDEFGEFGDKAEDMATPSTHNKKSSLNVDNAQYAAASASISMHRINVMICTAWGYARNFQELRKYLLQKYPAQLDASSITGENYPSPEPAATLAMITQVLQLGAMPLLFFGDSLMGGPNSQPEWYKMILANKMALFFFVYIANAIAQNAAQTGAFEIVHNGKVVFSKLENGQLPNLEEIVNGLRRNGLTM